MAETRGTRPTGGASPLARFLGASHPTDSELAPPPGPPGPPPQEARQRARRRRRRLLAGTFVVALLVLLLLNTIGLAARWANPALARGLPSLAAAAARLLPGGEQVRVFRAGPVRALANRLAGPVRVGIQVGHLAAVEQPDELAELRYSTGAHAAGIDEVEVNLAVSEALAARLLAHGFQVDLLPATIPPAYRADLVLAIHADSSPDQGRNGYKSAHFLPARNAREALLKVAVDRAILLGTGLRDDDRNVSGNMLQYYAFNHRRFRHSVSARTPALIVELGYLSNPADLRQLTRPDELAAALERGVLGYLSDIGRFEAPW